VNILHPIIVVTCCAFALPTYAASGQDNHSEHDGHAIQEYAAEGPHGGRLLSDGEFALEITIFEDGIPPEMRIYPYQDHAPLDPGKVDLELTLSRLGGAVDKLSFNPEFDYLVSEQVVTEPHSFDVEVNASAQGKRYQWSYDSHEGRTVISARHQALAQLEVERAEAREIAFSDTLFGVIAAAQDNIYHLDAPYPSLVTALHVNVGDKVKQGDVVATLRNNQTLQTYELTSPAAGEVTARLLSVGERADKGPVLEITDLSSVWVELSAFPENIEKIAPGQAVTVYDLHQHEQVTTTISYVAPQMTGGHIARARAVSANEDGHWRPGMHLKADVEVSRRKAPLAVRTSALQTFRGMPVVFARYGDTFEVRMVQLGDDNGTWAEVLGGLEPGTEYVVRNSFLVKADVLKDCASHDH